jgi:hypothetical protein
VRLPFAAQVAAKILFDPLGQIGDAAKWSLEIV